MSDAPQTPETPETPENPKDFLLDLDFTPDWARKDPGITADVKPGRRDWGGPGERREERDRSRTPRPRPAGERRDAPRQDRGGDRGPRPAPGAAPAAPAFGAPAGGFDRGPRPAGDRPAGGGYNGPRGGDRGGFRGERPAYRPRLPIRVDFIPQREKLAKIVALAKKACQAYPLGQLAAQFMNHPDSIQVKLTPAQGADPAFKFYSSKATGHVFLLKSDLENFLISQCLDQRFESAEVEIEAPTGSFPVVARCSLNGEWVGPPNHHEYRDHVEALRLAKYPHLNAEAFARNLEMVREPEAIEAWRQSQTKQVRYGLKGAETKDLTRKQAEDMFREKFLAELMQEGARCIVPLPALLKGSDPQVADLVRQMHEREKDHPFSILLALRPAFKQMGLHLFRSRDTQFVTSVQPHPLAEGTPIVAELGDMLKQIQEKPGCKVEELIAHFAPGTAVDSPEANKVKGSLRWLVEKGNVIHFFDNALVVPRPPTPPSRPKADKPAGEEPAAEAVVESVEVDATPTAEPVAEEPKAE